jgi:hypothetical protein
LLIGVPGLRDIKTNLGACYFADPAPTSLACVESKQVDLRVIDPQSAPAANAAGR